MPPPAPRGLLRLRVCRLRQHASQPAPPEPVCRQVSPGCVLSRRGGPAASATEDEEISVTGPGGNTLLMGGTSPWKHAIDVCRHAFSSAADSPRMFLSFRQHGPRSHSRPSVPQTPSLPLRVSFAVIWRLFCSYFHPTRCSIALLSHTRKRSRQPRRGPIRREVNTHASSAGFPSAGLRTSQVL